MATRLEVFSEVAGPVREAGRSASAGAAESLSPLCSFSYSLLCSSAPLSLSSLAPLLLCSSVAVLVFVLLVPSRATA